MNELRRSLHTTLERQQSAFNADGVPDAATRQDRIARLIEMLVANQDRIVEVERLDFQNKSPILIRLAEVMGTVAALRHTQANVASWMQPEPVPLAEHFESIGVRAEIQYQPLGTVGVISPWNGPIILTCMPLAGVLAAGNRAMIKPSELAPHSAELLAEMVQATFDETEIAVCCGGIEVAQEFIRLPFDHLLYTGSDRVARKVLAAAAENLVPVTLELGGKSPVVLGPDADLEVAAERLAYGKLFHGGQVCVTPDYLFVHEDHESDFVDLLIQATERLYPRVIDNEDYSPIVNAHHYNRLAHLVQDAVDQGAQATCINPAGETWNVERSLRFPPHLLRNVDDSMAVMGEEIFGPVLPIMPYSSADDVFDYIRSRPHPLSAYYFGDNADARQTFCERVTTGSVVFNDVVCQIFHEEIPFGGVGPSGMGRYRGHHGFKTFSNALSVLTQTDDDNMLKPLRPPYGAGLEAFVSQQLAGPAE